MGKYLSGIFVTLFFCSCAGMVRHEGGITSQIAAQARLHVAYTLLPAMQEKAPGQSVTPPPPRHGFSIERILLGLACVLTAGALFIFVWKRWQVLDEPPPGASPPEKENNP